MVDSVNDGFGLVERDRDFLLILSLSVPKMDRLGEEGDVMVDDGCGGEVVDCLMAQRKKLNGGEEEQESRRWPVSVGLASCVAKCGRMQSVSGQSDAVLRGLLA